MIIKELKYRIIGETDLIMHNGQLANPHNSYVKASAKITAKKRHMTEADLEKLAELQFMGSLYLKDGKPFIPGEIWTPVLQSGAKAKLKGKDFQRAVQVDDSNLVYKGPTDPKKMWKAGTFTFQRMVVVGRNKVLRTRVVIPLPWSCEIKVNYDTEVLNAEEIDDAVIEAGKRGYLMDWRGVFGKYIVEKIIS
jgi:hypothetical protein